MATASIKGSRGSTPSPHGARSVRITEQPKLLTTAASEPKLGRPSSAPRLTASSATSASALQASRGFSANLSTSPVKSRARPQTSSGVRSMGPQTETELFVLRDLPSLGAAIQKQNYDSLLGSVGERVVRESLQKPPAQQARRKGTQAWVQGDVQRAIQEFSSAIDLEPAGSRARIEALQLRCAGLLRAGRHEEARRCPARQHTSLHPLSALHLLRRHGHRRR